MVQMLKEHYTLPFQTRPNLTRSPTIISCYVHPHWNLYLFEALHQMTNKNAVELVKNQESMGFYIRIFLVPKPNNKWKSVLDLSNFNKFLKAETNQNGDIRNDLDLPTDRTPTTIYKKLIKKIPEISCTEISGQKIPVPSTTIWSVHSSLGVHSSGQRGQTDGFTERYKNPPVPRRLIGPGQIPPNLSPTYTNSSSSL